MTQDYILARLLSNNAQWAEDVEKAEPGFLSNLAKAQTPKVLWIGCADSRVPESVVTASKPGDIFVHRNIANLQVASVDGPRLTWLDPTEASNPRRSEARREDTLLRTLNAHTRFSIILAENYSTSGEGTIPHYGRALEPVSAFSLASSETLGDPRLATPRTCTLAS